jgi:hypothetical protein
LEKLEEDDGGKSRTAGAGWHLCRARNCSRAASLKLVRGPYSDGIGIERHYF